MTVSDLLADLGRFVSVPLSFDERGLCVLVCDDRLKVEIANIDAASTVLLTAALTDGAALDPAAIHAFALTYAHDLQRTRGAAISIDPGAGGRVELQAMRRAEDLDPERFHRFVGDFIAAAREARAAFATAGQTAGQPGPGSPLEPADGAFILRL